MRKRGQVTIFIVMGVLILLIVAGVFYLRSYTAEKELGVEEERAAESAQVANSVKMFVESCLDKTASNGELFVGKQGGYFFAPERSMPYLLNFVPYYFYLGEPAVPRKEEVENQLTLYIKSQLSECLDDFLTFPHLDITQGDLVVSTKIVKDNLEVDVDLPLQVQYGDIFVELHSFEIKVDSKMDNFLDIAMEIVQIQEERPNEVLLSELNEISERQNVILDLLQINNTMIYMVMFENTTAVKDFPQEYNFAIYYDWFTEPEQVEFKSGVDPSFVVREKKEIIYFLADGDLFDEPQAEEQILIDKQWENAGFDLVGCDATCNYNEGTGELTLSPLAVLSSIPEGVKKIDLTKGGTVNIGDQGSFAFGVYDVENGVFSDGLIEISGSELTVDFKDTDVIGRYGEEVEGSGKIENGELVYFEDVDVIWELGVQTNIKDFEIDVRKSRAGIYYGLAKEGFECGGGISIEGGVLADPDIRISYEKEKGVLVGCYHYDWESCNYKISGSPTGTIRGAGDSTFTLNEKEHSFVGDLSWNDGVANFNRKFESVSNPRNLAMIDGVYFRVRKTDEKAIEKVDIYFDDKKHEGNYVNLGEKFMAEGSGYLVAFGQKEGQYFSDDFKFAYMAENKYVKSRREDIPARFIVEMKGGKMELEKGKIEVERGGVSITNGVSVINYYREDGKISYTYQPAAAGFVEWVGESATDIKKGVSSAGFVDVEMHDGGTVNVLELPSNLLEAKSSKMSFTFNSRGVEKKAELDTGKVYLLGYKGGSFAREIAAEGEDESKIWGHAGIMYHLNGEWWVAEATENRYMINKYKGSTFAEEGRTKLDVIREFPDSDARIPIIKSAGLMAGTKYGTVWTDPSSYGDKTHCAAAVAELIEVGGGKVTLFPSTGETKYYDWITTWGSAQRSEIGHHLIGIEERYMAFPSDVLEDPAYPEVEVEIIQKGSE